VSPANEDDREEVAKLSEEIQRATGETVELAYVDQGYRGERASGFAAEHGIQLEVVKYEEAKRGFVLLRRAVPAGGGRADSHAGHAGFLSGRTKGH
jgi:hypothetical protein